MTGRPFLVHSPATSEQFLHSLNVYRAASLISCPLLPLIYDSPRPVLFAQPIYSSTGPEGQDLQKTIATGKTDEKGYWPNVDINILAKDSNIQSRERLLW